MNNILKKELDCTCKDFIAVCFAIVNAILIFV